MDETIERRKHPRKEVKWSASVLTDGGTIEAETRDISVDGISVRCKKPLRMNEVFRMGIMPPGGRMIEFTGEVVWSDLYGIDEENVAYGMGVCFVELSKEDRHVLEELLEL